MTGIEPLIEAALVDVAGRDDGHLVRDRRHAVLRALGDGPDARRRRAILARATVQRVLPLWRKARPKDAGPGDALAMIDGVLSGAVTEANARAAAGYIWAGVDDLIARGRTNAGLYVGYAASRALLVALVDEPMDSPTASPANADNGCDPRRLDTAFLASTPASGGTPWGVGASAAKRRTFWTWWLAEATAASSR